jgi:hypothetical protein
VVCYIRSAAGEEIVREQMEARLKALKSELEAGEAELAKVENQRTYLRETLLRISGAVQVIEELLVEGQNAEQRDGTNLDAPGTEPTRTGLTSVRTDKNDEAT